ncbi:MAG: biotin/lipoyl-binding protein [Ignavibacteriae bacterium]|nr:biotin/lipoyl-binding protein [Ignavibacteriota bacterium]
MPINKFVSSELHDSLEPLTVSVSENSALVSGITIAYSIEQQYPFVVNLTGDDGVLRSMIVKLDLRGKPIVSYCGYSYPMEVLSEKENYYNQILLSGKAGKSSVSKIPAPMPGLIKSVNIVNGQTVKKGETLFVLEAMKMENSIKSPVAGCITNVTAKEGIAVDKNTLLCLVEPIVATVTSETNIKM